MNFLDSRCFTHGNTMRIRYCIIKLYERKFKGGSYVENIRILKEQLEAAKGMRPFDTLIKNVKIVNVFTEEIIPGSIGIYGQRIVALNPEHTDAKNIIDGQGCYAVPGFIDSHIHIETTLLTPEALGDVIIPWGTTSLCVDAMEIANVAGIEGLQAMIRDMDRLPFRLFLRSLQECLRHLGWRQPEVYWA